MVLVNTSNTVALYYSMILLLIVNINNTTTSTIEDLMFEKTIRSTTILGNFARTKKLPQKGTKNSKIEAGGSVFFFNTRY